MPSAPEVAQRGAPQTDRISAEFDSAKLVDQISAWLDDAKAEEIVAIDLSGKSTVADFMIIASGRTDRHVGAIADQVQRKLKEHGYGNARAEGQETCDWVLLDTGDVVLHIFRPEVREFYNLEKMWQADRPADEPSTAH